MPSVERNLETWAEASGDWWNAGDDWSEAWGGPEAQWHTTLRPRLRRWLPAASIVEIAPGFGRWTQFLLGECDEYVGVDLTPRCVEHCRERFAGLAKAHFEITDGRSLPGVADGSVDLLFSFDSLVHVELDVLEAYLREARRVLKPTGVAFIHHSNAGACVRELRRNERFRKRADRLPPLARRGLDWAGLLDWDHWRALTPTAEAVRGLARQAGLSCLSQEIIPWGGRRLLLDCMSVFGADAASETRVLTNRDFMAAARSSAIAEALLSPRAPSSQT